MDFPHLLRSCADPCRLRSLHALLVVSGLSSDALFSTRLVNLYSRFGDARSSLLAFRQVPEKTSFLWSSMISCYARNGLFMEAVRCFYQLVTCPSGVRPDAFTFPAAVKACSDVKDGRKMHSWVVKLGVERDLYGSASLIHMYSRFGLMGDAHKVFLGMPARDLGSWNAMVAGFCQNGMQYEAIDVFGELVSEGMGIDPVTISSILPACAPLEELLLGMLIHVRVMKLGLDSDVYVCNAFIDMYAKLGCVEDAYRMFDGIVCKDLVSWNSMISAYEKAGDPIGMLKLYAGMKESGFSPDVLTLISLASGFSQVGDGLNARALHSYVLRRGWDSVHMIIGNAVVDMYGKLNMIKSAKSAFDRLSIVDVISWNTLINAYSQNGLANEAIELFNTMENQEVLAPNQGSLVAVLPAFSHLGALRQGMRIHARAVKNGLDFNLFVGTCLIDMYAKCGRLDATLLLFEQLPNKSSISWNTIISGHGIHGNGAVALDLFAKMREEGVQPDTVTFLSLLSACSHAGLVDHGKRYFRLMETCGIEPCVKHCACMVDILGRSGDLDAAYEFIKDMPLKPDAGVWGALLSACRVHGNVELGRFASKHLLEIDPENVGFYVLLSNMYAKVGKWEEVDGVRNLAKGRGLRKIPGWSSIEMNNKVHVFFTGNQSHPQSREIYDELGVLLVKMKALGYSPDYSCALQDVEEDEKEHFLMSHNERLAIAFGIISTLPKTPIWIFKNLRVCVDCHNATKFIATITNREIVVRDSNRFHHFKEGACSCGDYW